MAENPRTIDYDGASMPSLVQWMSDPNPNIRADATCAVGDRLRTREIDGVEDDVREKIASLIDDPVPIVRFEAAITLAELHDERATQVLLNASKAKVFRLDAIRALGTLGNPDAIPSLRRVMSRFLMPWADKLQAAAALCALDDDDGARYLGEKVHSRRFAERAAAVHFLGESKHPSGRMLLESILQQKEHPLRDVAARALGLMGDPDAAEALRAARADADEALVQDIDHALELLEAAK